MQHSVFAFVYDTVTWAAERTVLGRLRSQLLRGLQGDILEVGAGTGANFAHYSTGARVLALEPDRAMFARAQRRVRDSAAAITLELAGDERLATMPARSFDAVVFTLVLCTVPDMNAALSGARRVLKSSGRLVVLEHVRSPGALGTWQDRLRPVWERLAAGCQLNRDIQTAIAQAGFDVSGLRDIRVPGVVVHDLIAGVAPTTQGSGLKCGGATEG